MESGDPRILGPKKKSLKWSGKAFVHMVELFATTFSDVHAKVATDSERQIAVMRSRNLRFISPASKGIFAERPLPCIELTLVIHCMT